MVDQTTHPPKCHSFVGLDRQLGSSPPAEKRKKSIKHSKWIPVITRGTHTRLPEGRHILSARPGRLSETNETDEVHGKVGRQ